jgi:glycosyltransferase involved in cell wall biosynthesis
MKDNTKYPKILIINHSRINTFDAHGVSIRTWFSDWPHENLAQIYSGGESDSGVFCKYNFKLGPGERRFGNFFFKLKGSSFGQSSYESTLNKENHKLENVTFFSLIKYQASKFLINTGLWELIFRPKLSSKLLEFTETFNPDVIYCQGYNLTFTWLPVMIHQKFKIPICFQTGDDWPLSLYSNSPISLFLKPVIHRSFLSLLSVSKARLASGKLMSRDYEKRYKTSFEPLMMCDDISRFRSTTPKDIGQKDTKSIMYSGGLTNGRWMSIVDLSKAAKELERKGLKTEIFVFASVIPKEAVNKLNELGNVEILPNPSHNDLPSYLKGADVLFLPETFNRSTARNIRLSISTKAHLYMMSEKPVLLYGSPKTGIIDYAKTEKWGLVVEEQNIESLSIGLLKLLTDSDFCQRLVNKGIEVAAKNHDKNVVRKRLLDIVNTIRAN